MRFVIFAIIFILITGLASYYVARQLLRPARLKGRSRYAAVLGICAVVLVTPVTVIFRGVGIENPWVDATAWVGYIGLGFLSFVLTFLILRDFVRLPMAIVARIQKGLSKESRRTPSPGNLPDYDRRRFLLNSVNTGILAGAGVFTGIGVAEAKQIPAVKEVAIPINDLPRDLEGFRIVQITDIHVSPTIKRPFVQGVVDVVNRLSADIVALTGDLVDGSVSHLSRDVAPLKEVRSRYGNYFVTGNHEYYSGAPAWIEKVRSLGFTVLLNEHQLISHGNGRLLIAGVTDLRGGSFYASHRSDPRKAMADAPQAHLKILLAHQPKSIFGAARAGFDLQISGHTHGGQFFPWNLFVNLVQPFVLGLHKHENTQIYVSGGTGYWGPPLRLGAPSEITLLRLVKA